jgi:glycosyltransferase involved in cell wall biosynthesis
MPLKRYGIYIAYPPMVDLRHEGLGRHLVMFIKGAAKVADVHFTIVAPSWTRSSLESLFASEHVSPDSFRIVTPKNLPYALKAFAALENYRSRPKPAPTRSRFTKPALKWVRRVRDVLIKRAAMVHDASSMFAFLAKGLGLSFLAAPFALLVGMFIFLGKILRISMRPILAAVKTRFQNFKNRFFALTPSRASGGLFRNVYEEMIAYEDTRIHQEISALKDIRAWYCPTAFWPSFQKIKAPRLMCVPDVVVTQFPVGFAGVGGDLFLSRFETIGRAIRDASFFVTYSEAVKWETLVDRYHVSAHNITVIPHAPSDLSSYVKIIGFDDVEATSRQYCRTLFLQALRRSTNSSYSAGFMHPDVKFLFFASQFRPNKNIPLLLSAFKYLLRERYMGHKLVLTGHPAHSPEVQRFVIEHRLENDVLFLHGLSVSELAACYKLADLAVSPTLSEGGCPFTFTEALSVGTPAVMSRISVVEEILTDPDLCKTTLFDPYDWRDCANRIEWAIQNRSHLLHIQKEFYAGLTQRTWADVVQEYINALEKISGLDSKAKSR